jgi:hypothetical protein
LLEIVGECLEEIKGKNSKLKVKNGTDEKIN